MAAATAAAGGGLPAAETALEADAFKILYPEEYYKRFIDSGVRPDGRTLRQCRPVSVALGVVTSADASALVKLGTCTVLAGVKLEVEQPPEDRPNAGRLTPTVELTPLCSAATRPGRPSAAAAVLTEQLGAALRGAGTLDAAQLCIAAGRAAWAVLLDVYVLDADGSLLDAVLLAAAAALRSLSLPAVSLSEDGAVVTLEPGAPGAALALGPLPLALTCGWYGDGIMVDLTREEEDLMQADASAVMDDRGRVIGLYKAGGSADLSAPQLQECFAVTATRHADLMAALARAKQG